MTARDSRPSALENLAAAENSAPPSPLALTSSAGAVATFRSAEAAAPANRLAHVSERFARFYSDLENEKASRREVETGRRNALYDQVQRLELELENETKRRADADEETRRAIERELKNFERAAETRVQDALAGVKSTLDTLASSLAELHAGLREEREQRRVDVEHLASSVVAKVDECASAVDDERVDRLRREAATLRRVGEDVLRLQEKVDGERSVREAALADVSSAVAELRRAKRGDEDAFHVVALGEIAAAAINAEKEERVAEDESIVRAINEYTRALQDGLRIVNQS
ncbi:uncharacterized protein MICPUCDRAFT_16280 [Micromonas pusilla CCMP1545]|uniref:Predicted protein n=1 Tax=Micromonas pusilla (strain CCMP1545) TaxID=564608 RepID=C1MQN8_MICPC|nr:uncharacterized protein MICPUCDRAFT_16280 [Micromonas pusilla CCMP1545]EEH57742.1 predicted protein [Micromonas pusilla CCMP1545]|eukprot:XP_003057791.1 predicted protein [Micromonas pusilla CCMP1545]